MPKYRVTVGGQVHEFEAADDAEAGRRVDEIARRFAPPGPAPLTPPGMMPPGTTPGNMAAKPGFDASMVPLSEEAQRAQRLMQWGAITGNQVLERAGERLWKQDPTAEARQAQSTEMGKEAARRANMQVAGENIMKSFAKLMHRFNETSDPVLTEAIGPYAVAPYSKNLPLVGGMTPPEAAAAYRFMPRDLNRVPFISQGPSAQEVWDAQNAFKHLTHGLTNTFMAAAGKGLNMSDARQQVFASAMEDFMKSTDRKAAQKILEDAKTIIMNDFHLTPEQADRVLKEEMARIREEDAKKRAGSDQSGQRSAGGNSGARSPDPRVQAQTTLLANADNPQHIQWFNEAFNGGRPGLAESIIMTHRAGFGGMPSGEIAETGIPARTVQRAPSFGGGPFGELVGDLINPQDAN